MRSLVVSCIANLPGPCVSLLALSYHSLVSLRVAMADPGRHSEERQGSLPSSQGPGRSHSLSLDEDLSELLVCLKTLFRLCMEACTVPCCADMEVGEGALGHVLMRHRGVQACAELGNFIACENDVSVGLSLEPANGRTRLRSL